MRIKLFFSVAIFLIALNTFSQDMNKNEWQTYFEQSGNTATPDYEQTMEYFHKLTDYSDYAKMLSFGKSPQEREMYVVVVSKDKAFTPGEAKKTGKPIVFIESGIHSGEIEGKDACMLLLREILVTREKEYLIDNAILMIVPIFNVDGHERSSPFSRINQNGPDEMGWRTTSQNLNLNRDWTKADSKEMLNLLHLFTEWLPDFFVDVHTTDGADYQYTITYAIEKWENIYSGTRNWIKENYIPFIHNEMDKTEYLMTQYVSFRSWFQGLESGITESPFGPRYSQGYAAIQNRPGLLIETHMLKPYKDRVYSTKKLLEATIQIVNNDADKLVALNKEADKKSIEEFVRNNEYLPLSFGLGEESRLVDFKGVEAKKESSRVSGTERTIWTDNKIDMRVNMYDSVYVKDSVQIADAYLIPVEWAKWENLIDRISAHGINYYQLNNDTTLKVKRYKFKNVEYSKSSYESRQRVSYDYDEYYEEREIPAGTFVIPSDQRTVRVIAHLLEPKGDDSFVRWGFFNQIFERKEYFEMYVMEKMVREMMKENPELKKEFEAKLESDEEFRKNPYARLQFFYEKTPYVDEKLNVYPVMMVE